MSVEYKIEEHTGVDTSAGLDPDQWENVPVWHIIRYSHGMGWFVGKYRDRKAAEVVKAALDSLKGYEHQ